LILGIQFIAEITKVKQLQADSEPNKTETMLSCK